MQWLFPAIVATFFNTSILALVYLYLYRQENETSLLLFFISWSLYSLRYVFMILNLTVPHDLLLIGNQLSVLVSSHLLLVAFNRWMGRKTWPIGWTVATGVGIVWIVGAGFTGLPFTIYTVPGFFYVGLIYIRTGILILRRQPRIGLGNQVVAITLIVWGIHKIDYPFLLPVSWFAPWGYLIGALAAVITGIGMILVYFEETRELLKDSLREKEILLKEIHHRVKNNLAILHSLVKFQADAAENGELRDVLGHLETKIFAFALIHTKLFESSTLDRIDLEEYIRLLTHHLGESFSLPQEVFHLEYSADRRHADINTGKNLGLILNELVTNSVKYAFPDRREKSISIRFENCDDGECRLVVADNGIGFDTSAEAIDPKMSGLYLVKLLCDEIKGSLSIRRSEGAEVSVTFPFFSTGERDLT